MGDESRKGGILVQAGRQMLDRVNRVAPGLTGLFTGKTPWTREQLRAIYNRTSEQVLEKTEETRKVVRLRMALLDIEHHLNRLYPDIGKTACDLWERGETPLLDNVDLRSKVELVKEYRARRKTLRHELQHLSEQRRKLEA